MVVDRTGEELRRRMKDLRSPILEGESLSKALQTLVERLSRERDLPITLSCEGQTVNGSVTDDGRGFDLQEAAAKGRLGLLGMKGRCELVGGKLTIALSYRGRVSCS